MSGTHRAGGASPTRRAPAVLPLPWPFRRRSVPQPELTDGDLECAVTGEMNHLLMHLPYEGQKRALHHCTAIVEEREEQRKSFGYSFED